MSKTNKKSLFGRFQNLAIAKRITLIYGGIFSFSLLLLSGFFFVNTTILEQNSVRKQLETTIVNIEQFLDNGGTLTNESLKDLLDNKYVEVSVFSYSENEGFNSHVGEIPAFIKQPPQLINENNGENSVLSGLLNKDEVIKELSKTEYHIRSLKELGVNRQEFMLEGPGEQKFMLLSTQYKRMGTSIRFRHLNSSMATRIFSSPFYGKWSLLILSVFSAHSLQAAISAAVC